MRVLKFWLVMLVLVIMTSCILKSKRFIITDNKTGASIEVSEDALKVDPGNILTVGNVTIEAVSEPETPLVEVPLK